MQQRHLHDNLMQTRALVDRCASALHSLHAAAARPEVIFSINLEKTQRRARAGGGRPQAPDEGETVHLFAADEALRLLSFERA